MVAEAKQRKALAVPTPAQEGSASGSSSSCFEGEDDLPDKSRRTLACPVKCHRAADAFCSHPRVTAARTPCLFFLALSATYAYVVGEVLQPIDNYITIAMLVLFHLAFACFLASWAAVAYHGPGSVPSSGPQLPLEFAAAFAGGRICPTAEFGPTSSWCDACESWKPVMAYHCPACNACGMWVDHHSLFAAQCVGFKNLRCFLVWHIYGQMLLLMSVPALLIRIFWGPQFTMWSSVGLFGFFMCLGASFVRARRELSLLLKRLYAGWPSEVMYSSFLAISMQAQSTVLLLEAGLNDWSTPQDVDEMQSALSQVTFRKGQLRGLFNAKLKLNMLTLVFGEKLSFLWLLPFMPGGSGDSLQPSSYDADSCARWAELAVTMEKHVERHATWEKQAKAKLDRLQRMSERLAPSASKASDINPSASRGDAIENDAANFS